MVKGLVIGRTWWSSKRTWRKEKAYGGEQGKRTWNWLKVLMGKGDNGKCNAQSMRNKDGDLITNPSEVLESWKAHYTKLLCDPSAKDRCHWDDIPLEEHPSLASINGPIEWKELKA
ncbi:hypothetical protein KI387_042253, partial [Taxus chinensis]